MLNNCPKNKGKDKYMLFKTGTFNGTLNAYSELHKNNFPTGKNLRSFIGNVAKVHEKRKQMSNSVLLCVHNLHHTSNKTYKSPVFIAVIDPDYVFFALLHSWNSLIK
jgi:hypothetical protein